MDQERDHARLLSTALLLAIRVREAKASQYRGAGYKQLRNFPIGSRVRAKILSRSFGRATACRPKARTIVSFCAGVESNAGYGRRRLGRGSKGRRSSRLELRNAGNSTGANRLSFFVDDFPR